MLMPARSTVDEMLVNPAAERRLATKLAVDGVGRGDVYRSSETGWAAVGSLAVGIVFAVVAASGGRGANVAGVGAVLLLLVAWRMSIAGIQVRRDGVRVGTAFSSKSVSWQDIDHFAVLPLGRFPYVGHVVLRTAARSRPSVCPQTRGGPIAIGFGSSGRSTSSTGCSSRGGNPKANASTGSRAPLRPAILLGVSDGIGWRTPCQRGNARRAGSAIAVAAPSARLCTGARLRSREFAVDSRPAD